MKLIVISSSTPIPGEIDLVKALFENGLKIFHIHKPGFSKRDLAEFIRQIPAGHQKKTFLHVDFPKFHSLKELYEYKEKYRYAFLSPIFDSISKKGYASGFNLHEIAEEIRGRKLIALGGIDEDKIETCRKLGFAGVAVLGAIWENNDPVEKFKRLKALCQKKDLLP